VTATADTGAHLTAEVRNDRVTQLPERGARLFMRFDAERALILPDESRRV
jgi:hypothetical protein